ncbi:MAG: hypothetical protein KA247_07225 [Bacteroidetes bacterium]|nr:hypothetical protein [Bacteroidota bacterium]
MIQQLLTNKTAVLILAGCIVAGSVAAIVSLYNTADDVAHVFDRSGNTTEVERDL